VLAAVGQKPLARRRVRPPVRPSAGILNFRGAEAARVPGSDPEPEDPLSPYAPSAVPSVPSDGRRWFALLVVGVMVLSTAAWAVSLLL